MSSFHVRELGNLGLIYAKLTPIKTNLTKIYADVSAIKTNSAAMKENTVHKNKSQYIYRFGYTKPNMLKSCTHNFSNKWMAAGSHDKKNYKRYSFLLTILHFSSLGIRYARMA